MSEQKTCPICDGHGELREAVQAWDMPEGYRDDAPKCKHCDGTGDVSEQKTGHGPHKGCEKALWVCMRWSKNIWTEPCDPPQGDFWIYAGKCGDEHTGLCPECSSDRNKELDDIGKVLDDSGQMSGWPTGDDCHTDGLDARVRAVVVCRDEHYDSTLEAERHIETIKTELDKAKQETTLWRNAHENTIKELIELLDGIPAPGAIIGDWMHPFQIRHLIASLAAYKGRCDGYKFTVDSCVAADVERLYPLPAETETGEGDEDNG